MEQFDIPVVLFFFKRKETTLQIIERLSFIKPCKIYLISDGPRNENEKMQIIECRKAVEASINWECQIIKNYADHNKGVYDRIGKGASWVLSKEETAIFLEDDNLPEITFFEYCKELLEKYKDDTRVLWICGTNYLEEYEPEDGSSYVFTRHLMPCGWASWSHKFIKFYDGDMKLLNDNKILRRLRNVYDDKRLYRQQVRSVISEYNKLNFEGKPTSWDFQMALSIRANNLFGISPMYNQIENIGVDEFSIHGGTTMNNPMTERFCSIKTSKLIFPLKHPNTLMVDKTYEKKVGNIILYPLSMRINLAIKRTVSNSLRKIFDIKPNESANIILRNKIKSLFKLKQKR